MWETRQVKVKEYEGMEGAGRVGHPCSCLWKHQIASGVLLTATPYVSH